MCVQALASADGIVEERVCKSLVTYIQPAAIGIRHELVRQPVEKRRVCDHSFMVASKIGERLDGLKLAPSNT